MTDISTYPTATHESVWAAFQESDRLRKEHEFFLTEKQVETDRQLKEPIAEAERLFNIGIIEVKFKAHKDHLSKVIRKANTLREKFRTMQTIKYISDCLRWSLHLHWNRNVSMWELQF